MLTDWWTRVIHIQKATFTLGLFIDLPLGLPRRHGQHRNHAHRGQYPQRSRGTRSCRGTPISTRPPPPNKLKSLWFPRMAFPFLMPQGAFAPLLPSHSPPRHRSSTDETKPQGRDTHNPPPTPTNLHTIRAKAVSRKTHKRVQRASCSGHTLLQVTMPPVCNSASKNADRWNNSHESNQRMG
jgi:hypothetical protein